jgi:hypothetical protein
MSEDAITALERETDEAVRRAMPVAFARMLTERQRHEGEDGYTRPPRTTEPVTPCEPKVVDVGGLCDDDEGVLRTIGGSRADAFNRKIVNEVALACARLTDPKFETVAREVAAALRDIGPRSALEAMRVARILAAHAAAMDAYALARMCKPGPFQETIFDRAFRASRTADALTEVFERARAGAKVIAERVERIIVDEG